MSEETSDEKRTPGSLHPDCSTADRATWLVANWREQAAASRRTADRLMHEAKQLEDCANDLECRIDQLEKRKP